MIAQRIKKTRLIVARCFYSGVARLVAVSNLIVACGLGIWSLGMLGRQVMTFLKDGKWVANSVLDLLMRYKIDPTQWKGLTLIFDYVNASFAIILVVAIMYILLKELADSATSVEDQKIRELKELAEDDKYSTSP